MENTGGKNDREGINEGYLMSCFRTHKTLDWRLQGYIFKVCRG